MTASFRKKALFLGGSLSLLVGLAWWFAGRAPAAASNRPSAHGRADRPGDGAVAAVGIAQRPTDPANALRLKDLDERIVTEGRRNRLSGREMSLANEADARAYAALAVAPPGAVEAVAACQLEYLKASDESCTVKMVGVFERLAGEDRTSSRLVALEDATAREDGPEEMGELDPTSDRGKEACRRYRMCAAQAVLGREFVTPAGMMEVGAWSSRVSPDINEIGEDFMKYRVGDDLGRALDQVLAYYEDANPWYLEGDDFDSLFEAGNAACAEKYEHLGEKAGQLVDMCRTTVGSFAMKYLIRRAMRRMLEP